jgi:hypothetical protein
MRKFAVDSLQSPLAGVLAFLLLMPVFALADVDDPPTRVARLAYVDGAVSFQPGGTDDWLTAPLNRPLTTGDKIWSDQRSRVELQLDGSLLRLSANTAVAFLNLADHVTQVQLSSGTLLVHVRRLDDSETYEIDTPNLAFTILREGVYRLSVDPSGTTTTIRLRDGQGEVTGGGSAYAVYANEEDVFTGTDELSENELPYPQDQDQFAAWSDGRDNLWANSDSANYVSPDVVGYEDLDGQGDWNSTPDYGYVWFPRGIAGGWAPYHNGHWAYIAPWGYTWVDDQPWGFAPFHYGRWVYFRGAWGWVPAPPRVQGVAYVRPIYAPALVAWVGVGAGVAWFALGPHEVYVPSYRVSRNYVEQVNVSNTRVNTTIINNIYNTTIVNRNVTVNNISYVNRGVPGAIAATSSQAFTTAQPVAKNRLNVDSHALAGARVAALSPVTAPTRQAVQGAGRITLNQPPRTVQTRIVVARTAPPTRSDVVRIAPPATSKMTHAVAGATAAPVRPATSRAGEPNRVEPPPPPAPTQARSGSFAPAAAPVHVDQLPAAPRPASPGVANSALEREHLQAQQQLQAQQAAERERVQQQQEAEHAQLAKQQAEAAKQQADAARQQADAARQQVDAARQRQQQEQLERQHQQQTEQLAQQHALEQQQLQQRQQEQRREQESQTKPPAATHREPTGPNPKP